MSFFGLSSSPRVFTKIIESTNFSIEKTLSKDYNSLRPCAIDGDLKRGTINIPRYTNMPIVKSGVSYHYSEVNTESKLIFRF